MSKISLAYDSFMDKLEELFPNKTYIPNPYSIEDNKHNFLVDGYGLKMDGETSILGRFNFDNTSHVFTVVFSKEVLRMDSDSTPVHDSVKSLKEDVFTLKKEIYDSGTLNATSGAIDVISFSSTSPISFTIGDLNNYISIEASFSVVISEQASNC